MQADAPAAVRAVLAVVNLGHWTGLGGYRASVNAGLRCSLPGEWTLTSARC